MRNFLAYGAYTILSRFKDRPGHMLTNYLSLALWQLPFFLLNLGIVFSVEVPEPGTFLAVGVLANALVTRVMVLYKPRTGSIKAELRLLLSLGASLPSLYAYLFFTLLLESTADVLVYALLASLFGIHLSPWFFLALFTLIFPIYSLFTLLYLPTFLLPPRHALSSMIRPLIYLLMGSLYPISVFPGPARDLINTVGLADMLNLLRSSASGFLSPRYFSLLLPYISLSFFSLWLSLELLRKTGRF